MRQLVWLDSAVDDLVRLREFIVKENPSAAMRAAQALKEAAQHLIKYPNVGKPVEDLPEYRDLSIRFGAAGYVMRYRINLDAIFIVHIRHYREIDFKLETD